MNVVMVNFEIINFVTESGLICYPRPGGGTKNFIAIRGRYVFELSKNA
jgi:hypothetical protein